MNFQPPDPPEYGHCLTCKTSIHQDEVRGNCCIECEAEAMTTNQTIDGVPCRAIEWAFERLEICQDQAFQSCECEECEQCGKMPDECSGTECAKTCQCSTCDHCSNALAMAELRALLDDERCTSCDDSGDLTDLTGEWRGYCVCPAGVALKNKTAAQPHGEPVYQVQYIGGYAGWRDVDAGTYAELKDDTRYMSRIVYAEQPAPVAVVPDGYCIMPRQLTAENGAKSLLLGEFKLLVTKECPECCELEEPTEGCSICDGEGEYGQKHIIPWDQIKYIYSKAVSGLAVRTESAKS